jgi:hypothetical protein
MKVLRKRPSQSGMMCMTPSVVTVAKAAMMAMATNTVGQATVPR